MKTKLHQLCDLLCALSDKRGCLSLELDDRHENAIVFKIDNFDPALDDVLIGIDLRNTIFKLSINKENKLSYGGFLETYFSRISPEELSEILECFKEYSGTETDYARLGSLKTKYRARWSSNRFI